MLAVPQAHSTLELLKTLSYSLDIFTIAKARGHKVRFNFHGSGGYSILASLLTSTEVLTLTL
jgi:hypothetical protein